MHIPGIDPQYYGWASDDQIPPPPPSIDKEVERIGHALSRWSDKWVELGMADALLGPETPDP